MEGKNGCVVLLLALVALCFYTGQSSARRSAIDFASPIQGGLKSAEQSCAECMCTYQFCFCADGAGGPSCRENCEKCVCWFDHCSCQDPVPYDQCKNFKAFVEEKIMLESTPTSAHGHG